MPLVNRQADLLTAQTALVTCIQNCETDIAAADPDSYEIGRVRDRAQQAADGLGNLGTIGIASPGN